LSDDTNKSTSNTLDYYNDELSRRAVGKLFDGQKRADEKGLSEKGLPESGSPESGSPERGLPEKGREKTKASEKRSARQNPEGLSDGEAVKSLKNLDTMYNFSLYRKKSRRAKSWDVFVEDDKKGDAVKTPKKSFERQNEMSAEGSGERSAGERSAGERSAGTHPTGTHPTGVHPEGKASKVLTGRFAADKPEAKPRPAAIQNAADTPLREGDVLKPPRFLKTIYDSTGARRNDEVDFYDDGEIIELKPLSFQKMALAAGGIVAALIIAVLAMRVSGVGKELEAAQIKVGQLESLGETNSRLAMENETLNAQVALLTEQLDALQVGGETAPQTENAAATTEAGTSIYVVQAGDTLSAISQKYYGTTAEIEKIQTANNMSGTDLQIGDELIIP
jgi:nucleoid-associated protein YgaU